MSQQNIPYISLNDYNYDLPNEQIAHEPLPRGEAKQLRYRDGYITHSTFKQVVECLTAQHLLFFNNTKVLPARMFFYKETGALIEVFLLAPIAPSKEIAEAMLVKGGAVWECTIGNLKKWKDGQVLTANGVLEGKPLEVKATLEDREKGHVRLSWNLRDHSFVDIVEALGRTPLPPYIKREAEESDKERYQTVYSKQEGAVAAPTAGLHFSEGILDELQAKDVEMQELTLHVGAGTFQPVKTDNAIAHKMHGEQVLVSKAHLVALIQPKPVVAVGTTSMRTLESLYWYGVKVMDAKEQVPFFIDKLYPYQWKEEQLPSRIESMKAILDYMERYELKELRGTTEIYIFPPYQFRVCQGLITNFHMPKSTLLLLVGAFIGNDWKKVYAEALTNDYRFLSYGDSSILFTPQIPR